jgi:hypothetical protein
MPFVVIGMWSGYCGVDTCKHREVVHDDSLREKYDAIQEFRYTDGTILSISTYDLDKPPQNLSYKSMLDKAVARGLTGSISVLDL